MTGQPAPDPLAALVARSLVADQLQSYCRAADQRDEAAFRAVFHPGARCALGSFEGSVDDYVTRGFRFLSGCAVTQHYVTSHFVEVDGLRARSMSYLLAFHRIRAGTPGDGPWSGHTPGVEEVLWTGGRYTDDFECRDGAWRIACRDLSMDWEQWEPSDVRTFLLRDAPARFSA